MKKIMLHATDTDVFVLTIVTASVLEGSEQSGWHLVTERISDTVQAHTIAAEFGD